jgi:carbonic anhydrase
MDTAQRLLLANKAWVKEKLDLRSDYFQQHAAMQAPEVLWVGCSDSRVPAEEVTGAEVGDLFVHRNIANQFIHTDFNLLSVLQYAVDILQVSHIIVCGHYGCGGIQAALSRRDLGLTNKWLLHIKDVYRMNQQELNNYESGIPRTNRLVELNTIEQVKRLTTTSIVQKAWKKRMAPSVHAWVYNMATGYINELVSFRCGDNINEIYYFDTES